MLVGPVLLVFVAAELLPLFMARFSCTAFAFIGTPKSDYTWRSGPGRALSDRYHRLKGSEWDPWEWILMRSRRCRFVAMRDELTARGLRRHGVQALGELVSQAVLSAQVACVVLDGCCARVRPARRGAYLGLGVLAQ